jgi:hypothetical protein
VVSENDTTLEMKEIQTELSKIKKSTGKLPRHFKTRKKKRYRS